MKKLHVVLISLVFIYFTWFFFYYVKISGTSMQPTLHSGEKALFITTKIAQVNRLSVVLIKGSRESRLYVKRVIGLPGERISIKSGKVIINNLKLPEDYLFEDDDLTEFPLLTVPLDSYFVLSDNRLYSTDSRHFGPVKTKDIIGIYFL